MDDYNKQHGDTAPSSGNSDEIAQLKKELAAKDDELSVLKEKAEGLSKDYESASQVKPTGNVPSSADVEAVTDDITSASATGFERE